MVRILTIDHVADILAPADEVRACLLDPAMLARCVPGAVLTAAAGTVVRGRIRIKVAAVPVQYAIEAEVRDADGNATYVVLDGNATDRRSGDSTHVQLRVSVTEPATGQTRCRISGELDSATDEGSAVGGSARVVVDRILPQFVRRLEEVAGERVGQNDGWDSGDSGDSCQADDDVSQGARRALPTIHPRQAARGFALVPTGVRRAVVRRAVVSGAVGGRVLRRVRSRAARLFGG